MDGNQALSRLAQCAGSQRNLAKLLGISEEHVSRWRKGHYPVPEWIVAMAEVMGKLPPEDWPDRWQRIS